MADRALDRSARFAKLWCNYRFKHTFIEHCRNHHVGVEVVNRIHPSRFEVLPKRWIIRARLVMAHEQPTPSGQLRRDPIVTEGFIWAAHSRYLLRRLTQPP